MLHTLYLFVSSRRIGVFKDKMLDLEKGSVCGTHSYLSSGLPFASLSPCMASVINVAVASGVPSRGGHGPRAPALWGAPAQLVGVNFKSRASKGPALPMH